jgi:hypothetical protein
LRNLFACRTDDILSCTSAKPAISFVVPAKLTPSPPPTGAHARRDLANLTRRDGGEFFTLAPQIPVSTEVHRFPLARANEALDQLRRGAFQGAAVLEISG